MHNLINPFDINSSNRLEIISWLQKLTPEQKKEFSELYAYRKGVELAAEEGDSGIDYNSGEEHAIIVMENIFKNAKSTLNIFTGSFDERVCYNPRSKYYDYLIRFLVKGGKLRVLLNELNTNVYNKTLDLLKDFLTLDKYKQNIVVKTTTEKPAGTYNTPIHFTVADNKIFREEYDTELFKARFSFNNEVESSRLNHTFNEIFNNPHKSQELNLLTLPY